MLTDRRRRYPGKQAQEASQDEEEHRLLLPHLGQPSLATVVGHHPIIIIKEKRASERPACPAATRFPAGNLAGFKKCLRPGVSGQAAEAHRYYTVTT